MTNFFFLFFDHSSLHYFLVKICKIVVLNPSPDFHFVFRIICLPFRPRPLSHPLGIVFDKFAALRGQPRLLVLDRHRVIEVKLDAASMVCV
jgi:hypothetical protein